MYPNMECISAAIEWDLYCRYLFCFIFSPGKKSYKIIYFNIYIYLTLGFQAPNVRRYDWTPKTYHPKHLRRYDWKTRASHHIHSHYIPIIRIPVIEGGILSHPQYKELIVIRIYIYIWVFPKIMVPPKSSITK